MIEAKLKEAEEHLRIARKLLMEIDEDIGK